MQFRISSAKSSVNQCFICNSDIVNAIAHQTDTIHIWTGFYILSTECSNSFDFPLLLMPQNMKSYELIYITK